MCRFSKRAHSDPFSVRAAPLPCSPAHMSLAARVRQSGGGLRYPRPTPDDSKLPTSAMHLSADLAPPGGAKFGPLAANPGQRPSRPRLVIRTPVRPVVIVGRRRGRRWRWRIVVRPISRIVRPIVRPIGRVTVTVPVAIPVVRTPTPAPSSAPSATYFLEQRIVQPGCTLALSNSTQRGG
jgi:hypothetical protein